MPIPRTNYASLCPGVQKPWLCSHLCISTKY